MSTQSGTYRVGAIMGNPLTAGGRPTLSRPFVAARMSRVQAHAPREFVFVRCIGPTEQKTGAEFAPHAPQQPEVGQMDIYQKDREEYSAAENCRAFAS